MTVPWPLLALTYFSLAVFTVGVALRAAKYARAPMHLRWELYPVPHEKGKVRYGGSYFEDPDWWSRPRETSLAGEIKAMLEEMLLIRSLWHRNRPQWYVSFPFHGGLYLLIGLIVLLLCGAASTAAGLLPLAGILRGLATPVGAVGLIAATGGALGLLVRRMVDPGLRTASNAADYVNLLVLLASFLTAGYAWLAVDSDFAGLGRYLWGLLTLSPVAAPGPILAEVAVASTLLLYLPFTHMTHFVAKYFTYHQVRWDDRPSRGDPTVATRMAANLTRPVPWSGPHIQPDSSWGEVATEVK